jgi:hypothetical protein
MRTQRFGILKQIPPPTVGGGGGAYPQVLNFAGLPSAAANTGNIYVVEQTTGNWFTFNRRPKGFYLSNGSSWEYLDDLPDFVKDGEFRIQNTADQTKQLAFNLSSVPTSSTITLTPPDSSGKLATDQDSIINAIIFG